MMDLKIDDLQAFLLVYKSGTFTKAAKENGLTQSALSQKIARLEDVLQTAVFIRHPRSLSLTASGEKLLRYAKEVTQRQTSFLDSFDQYNTQMAGVIRIAGFSSVMRSMIIPKLTSFLRENPGVSIEFNSYEIYQLEEVLKTNKADFIITDYHPSVGGIIDIQIDEEEYVIIQSKKFKNIPKVFIDHGPLDNATNSYFKHIKKKQDHSRIFLGEVYSIIDGVAAGLGKAVMSKHLIINDKRFTIIKESKRYVRPVVVSYFEQSYYSPLQEKVLKILKAK